MDFTILGVSEDADLQAELRACMEELGWVEPSLVSTGTEALEIVNSRKIDAVIVDTAIYDIPLGRFARELVIEHPNIKLLVIPPDNNPIHPVLKGVVYSGLILRPVQPAQIQDALVLEEPLPNGLTEPEIPLDLQELMESDDLTVTGEEYLPVGEKIELPDWLNGVETGEAQSEPFPEPEPDWSTEPFTWEENLISELETPPPLPQDHLEDPGKGLGTQSSPNEAALVTPSMEDLHSAVTTRLEFPANTDKIVEPIGESEDRKIASPDAKTSQDMSYEGPLATRHLIDEEFSIEGVSQNRSFSSDDSEPGTIPLGIQGLKLKYFGVILPGMPNHFLTRDLSERLGFILPQIHLTRGWKMTGISVRPTYLLWHFSLPASVCPLDAVAQIKQRTSNHIFTNFPKLRAENLSGDFWAPGYLLLSGENPPSAPTIREYITRSRQSY